MDREHIDSAWRGLRTATDDAGPDADRLESAIDVGLLQNAASLAAALRASPDPASAAAVQRHRTSLLMRSWPGDPELVSQLDGSLAAARRLRVGLDDVGNALADQRGGYLDLSDGMVWPSNVLEDGDVDGIDPDEEPERFLFVDGWGSRDGWADMADFADQLDDVRAREDLQRAIEGRARSDGSRRRWTGTSSTGRHGASSPPSAGPDVPARG